jgi:hypothetical protein
LARTTLTSTWEFIQLWPARRLIATISDPVTLEPGGCSWYRPDGPLAAAPLFAVRMITTFIFPNEPR